MQEPEKLQMFSKDLSISEREGWWRLRATRVRKSPFARWKHSPEVASVSTEEVIMNVKYRKEV